MSSNEDVPQSYLAIIGNRHALGWVLESGRMAFPSLRRAETRLLRPGDTLLIYITRECFRSRARSRGRVIGEATVSSEIEELSVPVDLGGREFHVGCTITVHSLASWGAGVELAEHVELLETFPDKTWWSARLRRPLLALSSADASYIRQKLTNDLCDIGQVLPTYLSNSQRSGRRPRSW